MHTREKKREVLNTSVLAMIVCDKFVNGIYGNNTEWRDCTQNGLTRRSCDSSETTAGERS